VLNKARLREATLQVKSQANGRNNEGRDPGSISLHDSPELEREHCRKQAADRLSRSGWQDCDDRGARCGSEHRANRFALSVGRIVRMPETQENWIGI
jgi:hypothetical protein